jgi:hypothetical protein
LWSPSSAEGGIDFYSLMREPEANDLVIHFNGASLSAGPGWLGRSRMGTKRHQILPNGQGGLRTIGSL